jgi:hypothetical protein
MIGSAVNDPLCMGACSTGNCCTGGWCNTGCAKDIVKGMDAGRVSNCTTGCDTAGCDKGIDTGKLSKCTTGCDKDIDTGICGADAGMICSICGADSGAGARTGADIGMWTGADSIVTPCLINEVCRISTGCPAINS